MKDELEATPSLESHEVAELFPSINPEELAELAQSIKANGQREPILLYKGKIADGRNRYAACIMAGVKPITKELTGKVNLLELVIDANLRRRHLDTGQRAMIAAQIANRKEGRQSKQETSGIPLVSQSEAAEKLNVSTDSVKQAAVVLSSNDPVLIDEVKNGKLSVNAAASKVREDRAKSDEEKGVKRTSKSAGPPPVLTHDQEHPPSQPINVRFTRKEFSNLVVSVVSHFTLEEVETLRRDLKTAALAKEAQRQAVKKAVEQLREDKQKTAA